MKITDIHKELLETGATGFCYRGQWKWMTRGEPVTRQVNAMLKNGLLDAQYYTGGLAACGASDEGRAVLDDCIEKAARKVLAQHAQ